MINKEVFSYLVHRGCVLKLTPFVQFSELACRVQDIEILLTLHPHAQLLLLISETRSLPDENTVSHVYIGKSSLAIYHQQHATNNSNVIPAILLPHLLHLICPKLKLDCQELLSEISKTDCK